ncbi:hypothetical protein COB11_03305 [Candidatus Aerophobetes bacterium]|uniref:Zinc finger RING-type eukaryotic domain-containing protein n=1 Tax=Aerophobetes bacterium TaxID=2030807 RepID=A0A2A4YKE9_UNCAE|nr:MAG: hypothetical protein COB11_03305 [Candidatus Aerophobetes bacterium]
MATIQLHRNHKCNVCTKPLVKPSEVALVRLVNKCGHIIHQSCLLEKLAKTVDRFDKMAPCVVVDNLDVVLGNSTQQQICFN